MRHTTLEDTHARLTPVARTGDHSDVMVIDADGRTIPWPLVSHFGNLGMRDLMRQVINPIPALDISSPHWPAEIVLTVAPSIERCIDQKL